MGRLSKRGYAWTTIYKTALFTPLEKGVIPTQKHIVHQIRSLQQTHYLIKQNKSSLSRDYDKRIIADNDIDTYAFGYNPIAKTDVDYKPLVEDEYDFESDCGDFDCDYDCDEEALGYN